ncbi:sigma 54-interacting transcriptional regulator [Enterococcus sp. LJL120]
MEDQILTILEKYFDASFVDNLDANILAQELSISRNRASSYLNQLVKDNLAIKINSRPVLFFPKKKIELAFNNLLLKTEFDTLEELKRNLQTHNQDPFSEVIGHAYSLANIIFQCKAAAAYSKQGLPIMLVGESGTGKTFLAEKIYQYSKYEGQIKVTAPFIHINCSEYANNPELFLANLFGFVKGAYTGAYKDTAGIIEEANQGYLFLDEIHCLTPSCQEKLFQFMDTKKYHRLGDNEKWHTAEVRFLFATTEYPSDNFLTTFLRRIPVILTVPSLAERTHHEKLSLISNLIQREEQKVNKEIKISNQLIEYLLKATFAGNIGEFKNILRLAIAKESFASSEKQINIDLSDLISTHQESIPQDSFRPLTYRGATDLVAVAQIFSPWTTLVKELELNCLEINEPSDRQQLNLFFKKNWELFKIYLENSPVPVASKPTDWIQQSKKIFNQQFEMDDSSFYSFAETNEDFHKLLYILDRLYNEVSDEIEVKQSFFQDVIIKLDIQLNKQLQLSTVLADRLNFPNTLILEVAKLCLLSYIEIFSISSTQNDFIGLIMAHGKSVATEIAKTINQLLNSYLFDSINLPLDANSKEALLYLEKWLSSKKTAETIVIMSDMGSLASLKDNLTEIHSNILFIDTINPPVGLTIGNDLLQKSHITLIESNAHEAASAFQTQIVQKSTKNNTILCSSAAGPETDKKIKQILEKAFPENSKLSVHTINYNELATVGLSQSFLENNEIKFIIGTLDPNISHIPFISIGDLIANNSLSFLSYVLSDIFTDKELRLLSKNLLNEFALTNLVNELTILNPVKLLSLVTKAIDDIQNILKFTLPINTSFGLYIHTCCMIERLIRTIDEEIESTDQQADFDQTFYQKFKEAFLPIETFYSVAIPYEEVNYIKNYIYNE